jgi:ribosomal protein S18 acetylase RimI-like enzyme
VSLDRLALRDVYDAQVRAYLPTRLPATAVIERDGPLLRLTGVDNRGFLTYRDLGDLSGSRLDELIARQREFFAARGEAVEWKVHGHDRPADLPDRLRAAGFEPEEQETVVIGLAAPLAEQPAEPAAGIGLREVRERVDLDRIMRMEEAVWGGDYAWHAAALEEEIGADPEGITVVVAETGSGLDDPVVSAGWIRFLPGTGFATLWGGSTLPEWRGRGIYRSLVAYRARLAVERGFTHLQVDASDDSRPILERLGFVAVTTTTPYVFTPPTART